MIEGMSNEKRSESRELYVFCGDRTKNAEHLTEKLPLPTFKSHNINPNNPDSYKLCITEVHHKGQARLK